MARFVLWPEPGDPTQLLGAGFGSTGTFVLWGEPGDDSQLLFISDFAAAAADEEDLVDALEASDSIILTSTDNEDIEADEFVLEDWIEVEEFPLADELYEALETTDSIEVTAPIQSIFLFEDAEVEDSIEGTYGDGALFDSLEISEIIQSQGEFSASLIEEVLVLVVHIDDDAAIEAWVVNLKTNGISRYSWPDFNSFVFVGGKYYGALSDGIYEITGDDDDGEQINMFATDGKRQLGSGQKKRVFAVYLDAETDGQVNLQVYADGQVYTYAFEVPPRNIAGEMHETLRASPGRGLRARNWVFEIQNVDGSDLDMSKLYIHPIVLDRRVR